MGLKKTQETHFMVTIKPKDLEIKYTDQFLFDTNIWLLLFGTISDYQKKDQVAYSNLLQKLITLDKPIFINSIILSEFANVLLRYEYNQWITNNGHIGYNYKKDFVGTKDYINVVNDVKVLINKILSIPIITKVSDNFNGIDLNNIYTNFGIADFNDAYLTEMALKNNYKIVTNDADFKNVAANINLITTK